MDTVPGRPHRPELLSLLAELLGAALLTAVAVVVVVGLVRGTGSTTTAIRGSGVAAISTRHVPPFTSVELAGGNDVVVRAGAARSVHVYADDNLLRLVTTNVREGRLVVGSKGSFSAVAPTRVEIGVPALDALELSGSGSLTVSGVDARHVSVTLSGSGDVAVSGRAGSVDARLPGSGDIDLSRLVARRGRAVVAGSGEIRLHVTGSLVASVSGSGEVVYTGDPPRVRQSVTGSGSVSAG